MFRTGLLVVLAAFAAAVTVAAARQAPAADPLPALIEEVRLLRATMERMVTAGPRIQILTSRLSLQEERVFRASGRLDSVRSEIENVRTTLTQLTMQVKQAEDAIARMVDPGERTNFEHQLAAIKMQMGLEASREQALRAREAEAAQELVTEQNRWQDLSQRLDDLERLLDRR